MELTGKLMEALGNLAFDRGSKYFYLVDNLRSLETKLQRLRNRKIDFESKVKVAERSGTKKRKREVENWFDEVAKIENEFVALKTSIQEGGFLENAISSGKRVEKMDEIVEQLMGQSDSDHFGELCLEASEGRGEPLEITELFGEMFRKGLETITAWLDTNEILRIGIWGMGGVGKTTLAEHIHNHLLKNTQSLRVYWVSVSQEFTIKGLQGDVAKRLGLDLSHEDDEKVRARKLRDAFEKMKEMVVLMLDDVWEEFRLNSLGIDARNCRLILTTRLLQVCNQMRCHPFELKTLDTEEAWGLFERTLGNELEDGDLKDTAKSVAKRCGGLPLGIVVMAGSMIGVTDIREWRNALVDLNRVEHGKMEDKVFPILEWSFNRLKECERNCFLYCCLFPEDSDIKRKELIDLFIGAELMSKRGSRSQEFDQGHTILNKLIRVCLLEKTTNFMTGDYVKMHDLVRDMALRITHGKSTPESSRDDVPRFLVKSLGQEDSKVTQEEWTEDLHVVSFYAQSSKEIEIPPAWSPNCPKLSTLLLSNVYIKEIPDSFFQHMWGLKVLNLSRCRGKPSFTKKQADLFFPPDFADDFPVAMQISHKYSLIYVITKLGLLFVYDLETATAVYRNRTSPDPIFLTSEATSVGGFYAINRRGQVLLATVNEATIVPFVSGQLNNLELAVNLAKRGNLPGAENLVVQRFQELFAQTKYKEAAELAAESPRGILRTPDTVAKFQSVPVQAGQTPPLLQYFGTLLTRGKLNAFESLELSRLVVNQNKKNLLENWLAEDKLECSEELGDLVKTVDNDLALKIHIKARATPKVVAAFAERREFDKILIYSKQFLWQLSSASPRDQLEVSSFSPLCDLKEIRLTRLPNLVGLFYGESEPSYFLPAGTFSSLKQLWIFKCHNMKQLFTIQLLQNLQNLEELDVYDCEGLEEIAADGSGVAQGGGEGIQLTSSEGATTNVILPKLRWLILKNLPQLKNICKAAMICDSIEVIKMFGCPKVKRLPLFLPTINGQPSLPSTLSKIRGDKEWWESLEWVYPSVKNALDPYFTTE